jgi:ABC-type branched-subunit amino acid transport system ATPase component
MDEHADSFLHVQSITKRFGGVVAVQDVSFDLDRGIVLGIIGPNGSGKTTLLNVLNGAYQPDEGEVRFRGSRATGLGPHQLVMKGLSRTFQNSRVFRTITTYQNMMVPLLHTNVEADEAQARAMDLLAFVELEQYTEIPASELSGGQQKLLEFARALMTDPVLILMDEPFAGVHPKLKSLLLNRIREKQKDNTSFIVVSHELPVLMNVSERVICMTEGRMIADGSPEDIREDQRVVEAYLGHAGRVR